MNTQSANQITHWCSSCNSHFPLHQVRHCIPVSTSPHGEEEVLQCPTCGSYNIEELQEVAHAQ
jgi:predicted  nucleic acid-binding Zn-ribbon protein